MATPTETILANFDKLTNFKWFAVNHPELPMPIIIDTFFGRDIAPERFAVLSSMGYYAQEYPHRIPR